MQDNSFVSLTDDEKKLKQIIQHVLLENEILSIQQRPLATQNPQALKDWAALKLNLEGRLELWLLAQFHTGINSFTYLLISCLCRGETLKWIHN